METKKFAANIANGTVHHYDHSDNISGVEWTKHPGFRGVYLKHIIRGADTEGLFSSHLVRIDPGCCLEKHCHENQLELHEVIEGDGSCQLSEHSFEYHLGKMAVIPKGINHRVQAGGQGLILLAKFFPALQ